MDEDYECCVMMWFIGTVFEARQKSIPQLCRKHFRCYYLLLCMYLSGVVWHGPFINHMGTLCVSKQAALCWHVQAQVRMLLPGLYLWSWRQC